jgi:enoyl-CoA hydratase/carnithine racemase
VITAAPESKGLEASTPFLPTGNRKYEYFQNVEMTSDGIAIVRFDNPNKKVNTISFKLKDEAEKLWEDEIHSNSSVKGVVFTSGKPDGFIAGADIFDIQSLEHKEDVIPLIQSATEFFHHLKSKGVPLVCAINGPALGGGLEWALWCDYRICTDSPKTKLGLPEVRTFVSMSLLALYLVHDFSRPILHSTGKTRTATRIWRYSELT